MLRLCRETWSQENPLVIVSLNLKVSSSRKPSILTLPRWGEMPLRLPQYHVFTPLCKSGCHLSCYGRDPKWLSWTEFYFQQGGAGLRLTGLFSYSGPFQKLHFFLSGCSAILTPQLPGGPKWLLQLLHRIYIPGSRKRERVIPFKGTTQKWFHISSTYIPWS